MVTCTCTGRYLRNNEQTNHVVMVHVVALHEDASVVEKLQRNCQILNEMCVPCTRTGTQGRGTCV